LKLTHNKHYSKRPQLSTRKPQIPKCKILQAWSYLRNYVKILQIWKRCIPAKNLLRGPEHCMDSHCRCATAFVAKLLPLGGRSNCSSRISIPLKTTLWSAFTYAVRLLCLCEIVPLKSYLGGQSSRSSI